MMLNHMKTSIIKHNTLLNLEKGNYLGARKEKKLKIGVIRRN